MDNMVLVPESDWQDICDATREKTGGTEKLLSAEVAPAVRRIESGEEVFVAPNSGIIYRRNMVIDAPNAAVMAYEYRDATELETLYHSGSGLVGGHYQFFGANKLREVTLPKCTGFWLGNTHAFGNNPALEKVSIGSIGVPVARMDAGPFRTPAITLELYVNAETIADIPALITQYVPSFWNVDATVIYRNSATGEVITE